MGLRAGIVKMSKLFYIYFCCHVDAKLVSMAMLGGDTNKNYADKKTCKISQNWKKNFVKHEIKILRNFCEIAKTKIFVATLGTGKQDSV